jgi:hypothetical protein
MREAYRSGRCGVSTITYRLEGRLPHRDFWTSIHESTVLEDVLHYKDIYEGPKTGNITTRIIRVETTESVYDPPNKNEVKDDQAP